MNLHEDKEVFKELVTAAAEDLKIDERIVEKDYYVTLLLKELKEKLPDMVFKGGTSLSKCYGNLINRFSEDIDISYSAEGGKPGDARKRNLKTSVIDAFKEMNLIIYNLDETRSRRDYNCYRATYDSIYTPILSIQNELIVETYVALLPYPIKPKMVNNYIHQFLETQKEISIINSYSLSPFEVTTQDISRTFIDKVFAVCDYYLSEKIDNHSRHLYDLYKLLEVLQLNSEMKDLVKEVRTARSKLSICPSAAYGTDINRLLFEIISQRAYEQDYQHITTKLIFETLPYEQAIKGISAIIESNIFKT